MTTEKFITHSELETRELGRNFAKNLTPGQVVLLYGDLGSGKTVFVRGVCEAFNISCVRSPSFTLINEYEAGSGLFIIHADLYRLEPYGVHALGLEEYADSGDSVMFVEWPERWEDMPNYADLTRIYFNAVDEMTREIRLEANS
ncbi:MAG: tRNA (adenosine(37)-N6)-threonylcarbamoyltransferase complex ATPase subunit type 1 TsaE [Synergistaceae bacterium]|nr:tRNA (adenosine(37)-N6)-threonylcarbamoyltransferase complex ATPase subunit type 1 TsaE [Synergistaceae bacterium]